MVLPPSLLLSRKTRFQILQYSWIGSDPAEHTKNFACIPVIYISRALIPASHVSFLLIIIEKLNEDKYSLFSFLLTLYLVCIPFLLFSKHKFLTCSLY